jgi:hypothetical protein
MTLQDIAQEIYAKLNQMDSYDSSNKTRLVDEYVMEYNLTPSDKQEVEGILFDMNADERYDDISEGKIKSLVKEILKLRGIKHDCGCGCGGSCSAKAPTLNTELLRESHNELALSQHIKYHVSKGIQLTENTFRYGSEAFLDLWEDARTLYNEGKLNVYGDDKKLITETDLGKFSIYEGKVVPLDLILEEEDDDLALAKDEEEIADEPISEADKKKKTPPIGKPKRGGSKKFYVYVRKPGGGIKKVSFGMAGGGLRAKLNNPKARQAFAKRHKCSQAKDRTTARYWSCRLPRYAKLLGFKTSFSGYW